MANTTISPNMNLPVPVVGVDPGPDWATNVNGCLNAIDSHNHSTGQGVAITPSGLNINADLPFNSNNGTQYRSVRFTAQGAPLSTGTDIGCLYESGVDLYYNDGNGNQVRITQSGSVTGATGTITGLPSGTAAAAYAAGTFTFQSATNTPANMSFGPTAIGSNTVSPKFTTIQSSASQASNLTITLPLVAGAANQTLYSDGSGNLGWTYGLIPLGSVIATFPNLTGAYSTVATTVADDHGFVLCQGQTISDGSSPMNGQVVPNINNNVFLYGYSTAGNAGGASTVTLGTGNLPAHTHGAGSYATSLSGTFASTSHEHNFAHYHQWGLLNANDATYTLSSGSAAATTITSGNFAASTTVQRTGSGTDTRVFSNSGSNVSYFTTGALGAFSGSGSSAQTDGPTSTTSLSGSNSVTGSSGSIGSGTAFSIVPPYITTVYLMRIR